MDEILRNLRAGTRVLDLGSLNGSFPLDRCSHSVVARVDLERPAPGVAEAFIQADAARLPFADRAFDAVIANHSLEHVHRIDEVLHEIGRVVGAGGSIFIAVPDGSTFSDRLFRWVYQDDSGHINFFSSREALAARITEATGLKLAGGRDLYSSFEYLSRCYFPKGTTWRLRIIGNGSRTSILLFSYFTRILDRLFGTRTSRYGWALYFGHVGEAIDPGAWSNVCVRCGSGAPARWLVQIGRVRRVWVGLRWYRCPNCNALNLFTPDVD